MTMPALAGQDRSAWLWSVSAADLAANLLCFFVLQFAMSETDLERFRAASEGIGRGLGVETRAQPRPQATLSLPTVARRAGLSIDYLAALLAAETTPGRPLAGASVLRAEDRVTLSLPGETLFELGGDQLRPEAEAALFALAGLLAGVPNRIEIQGRARPEAAHAERFPSSWELALMRAATVAARLRAAGYARALAISGQAVEGAAEGEGDAGRAAPERVDLLIGEGRAP